MAKQCIKVFERRRPASDWQDITAQVDIALLQQHFLRSYINAFLDHASTHFAFSPHSELRYDYYWDVCRMVSLVVKQEPVTAAQHKLVFHGEAMRIAMTPAGEK